MTVRVEANTTDSAQQVWPRLAEPARWHQWAPHILGARGLGSPEVREGARGVVWLLPGVPVPVRVIAVEPGRAWSWRAGPVRFRHAVAPAADGGSLISFELSAPAPLERALSLTYGPVMSLVARRLARMAAGEPTRT